MPERWLPVVGYEGRYEVSDHGRVRFVETGRVLNPGKPKGYPRTGLWKGRASRCLTSFTGWYSTRVRSGETHAAVAAAFGIRQQTISKIMSGALWRWHPEAIPSSSSELAS